MLLFLLPKADAALKQLLKIGVDTPIVSSTPPETPQTLSVSTSGVSSSQASLSSPGGNTYMRQVSLQELFEEGWYTGRAPWIHSGGLK